MKELIQRVMNWTHQCFGKAIAMDMTEREYRFLEETLELCQAGTLTRESAHKMVDYVFDRPAGDRQQEVSGVMISLAAYLGVHGDDPLALANAELDRIEDPAIITKVAEKQKGKPRWQPTTYDEPTTP